MGGGPPPGRWQVAGPALAAGRGAQGALPAGTLPLERLQVIVPALAAADPFRMQLDPPAVIAAGATLISGMIGGLSPPEAARGTGTPAAGAPPETVQPGGASAVGAGPGGAATGAEAGPVAGRLLARLAAGPVPPGLARALNAAMVLLADHELAASTLAVRVAASVRADPYAVVATGLGVLGGTKHGGASLAAETMLASAAGPDDAPRVVAGLLRRGERIPGFGHFVYTDADPRAVLLLDLIRAEAAGHPRLAVSEAVLAEVRGRSLPVPNIDFALATLTAVAGLTPGAGEAVFAIARTAGWLAHALEEYEKDSPIRPRSIYTGPRPAVG
jgi:citrate synthase